VLAWRLSRPGPLSSEPLELVDAPVPEPGPGEVRVRVRVNGLCRTDIHTVLGEITPPAYPIIPGHQVVGVVDALGEDVETLNVGERVGVAWLRETCGNCPDCTRGDENLCESSRFTGFHADGGYAEYTVVREDFAYRIPEAFDDAHAAPLLCAGIIGLRAVRRTQAGVWEKVGIYGFGSAAHIAIQILTHRGCDVYVVTRGEEQKRQARELGAKWVGGPEDAPPDPLDRAVIFASAGELVPRALRAVRRGGKVASAAIHMTDIPAMDYSECLFGERVLTSTTANTREDGIELLRVAAEIPVETEVTEYAFHEVHRALSDIDADRVRGTAVLRVSS
jgi:propanol-preferring alcohol dehydrogenase